MITTNQVMTTSFANTMSFANMLRSGNYEYFCSQIMRMLSNMEDRIIDEVVSIVMDEIEVQIEDEASEVIAKLEKAFSSLCGH